jgi:hypothetical protein
MANAPAAPDGVGGVPGAVLDAVVSAVGVVVVLFLPMTVLSFAFGADWYGVKLWLFVAAMVLLGISVWLLRPNRPWEDNDDDDTGGTESIGSEIGHFEASVHALPPLSWAKVPPDARASSGTRLLLASILLFALSFAMERVFSVCAPGVDC